MEQIFEAFARGVLRSREGFLRFAALLIRPRTASLLGAGGALPERVPPALAAVFGTAGELVLPVLLVLGLGGRFAALGLFVVNAVAVIALQEIAPAAMQQHLFWGSLLAALAIYGPGAWSLERLLWPRLLRAQPA